MLLCVTSDPTISGRPGNTAASFSCPLPEHYSLDTGRRGFWSLGLKEVYVPALKTGRRWDRLYLCCDACESSALGALYKPVLATFSVGEIKRNGFVRFQSVCYVPLRVNGLSELRVEICDKAGETLEELNVKANAAQTTSCTFSLKWMPNSSPWRP